MHPKAIIASKFPFAIFFAAKGSSKAPGTSSLCILLAETFLSKSASSVSQEEYRQYIYSTEYR